MPSAIGGTNGVVLGAGRDAFPRCRRCGQGELVPLSDFGPHGGEVRYKAWVCINPGCGFAVKIHGGAIIRHRGVSTRPK